MMIRHGNVAACEFAWIANYGCTNSMPAAFIQGLLVGNAVIPEFNFQILVRYSISVR